MDDDDEKALSGLLTEDCVVSIWYWIAAEFKALGWYCVAHGPEFWLIAPIVGAAALAVIIYWLYWHFA